MKQEVTKMSKLGVIALRFDNNSRSLKDFDEALRYFREKTDIIKDAETEKYINRMLTVLTPISDAIKNKLSSTWEISGQNIIKILKSRHEKDWATYKSRLLKLEDKVNSEKFQLSKIDYDILNDVADAIDVECNDLFNRMGET
jgi:hypothetical protein